MNKLCLLFVKFDEVVRVGIEEDYYGGGKTDILTIKEITSEEAKEIQKFYDDGTGKYETRDNFDIEFLDEKSLDIQIIKDKVSMQKLKDIFKMEDGYYSSTYLDLVDILRKNKLYNIYDAIINDIRDNIDIKIEDNISTQLDELLDSFNDFYVDNKFEDYEDFKNDEQFLDIVNRIENFQGLVGIPVIKEDIESSGNYDKNVVDVMKSYLE